MERGGPPHIAAGRLDRALQAFAGVVGKDWVLTSDEDRSTYLDVYALGSGEEHLPSAAVAPASTEEVQAIMRLANEHRVPLWPISRGKNFGYGGAAPRTLGAVVLDLGRMKRILEVNERFGYCLVEPGVGFFDLYDHLQTNNIPLWLSVPGNAWGSVTGNALERGFGPSPYGDHASKICGLEVVLPSGELVRTGMGAMSNNPTWPLFRYGYGPSWDGLFQQSNLGVVTKMGLWLMPEPEATLGMSIELPNADDIGWALDELCPLRMSGVLQQSPNIGNYLRSAAGRSQRSDWYSGPGAMPDSVIQDIQKTYGVGWWSIGLRLYGHEEINEANARIIQAAFAKHTDQPFKITRWRKGEPFAASGAGIPSVFPLQIVNWQGGRGGHIGFSPVLPPSGDHALGQLHRAQKLVREHGFDFYGSFTVNDRYINHVNMIFYNRDDAEMVGRVRAVLKTLIADTAAAGYGEYRAHIDFMDDVADSFDFNNHAQRRLNETLKDALDPNGILAPGKQGVWPKAYRGSPA